MDLQAWLSQQEELLALDTIRLARHQSLWNRIYKYYGVPLTDLRIAMFAEDMLEHEPDDVERAMTLYRRTPPPSGHKPRAPVPQDILPLLTGYVSPEAEAVSLAGAIFADLSTLGREGGERARQKYGETAYRIVERMGGWFKLCVEAQTAERHIFVAQFRDMALGELQRERNSVAKAPLGLALPEATPPKQAALSQDPEPSACFPRREPIPSYYTEYFDKLVGQVLAKS